MLKINIKSIPHKKQRYNTVGDYWAKNGREQIRISNMQNWRYELLVAIHEIIEAFLCKDREISEGKIMDFDIKFEELRTSKNAEPGMHKNAPYREEHKFATRVERMLARELGVNWKKYDKAVSSL
jgi:hypothetical protein